MAPMEEPTNPTDNAMTEPADLDETMEKLSEVDPADAPDIAESIADTLGARLEATGDQGSEDSL